MTHPSSPPAPMTAATLQQHRDDASDYTTPYSDGAAREAISDLLAHIDALTARVAELERERQYTCEQHRDEVRKGERCVWCELAAARGAFDLSESERQRLAGRINATEARKVEDGDVQDAVDWLRDRAECSSITLDPAPMGPIADLLTRLSAALKEAGQRASDHLRASEILNRHCVRLEARAQAAEAKRERAALLAAKHAVQSFAIEREDGAVDFGHYVCGECLAQGDSILVEHEPDCAIRTLHKDTTP